MEKIILYTTGCPRCSVLEAKLAAAALQYESISDEETMASLGITMLPVLSINNKLYDFGQAVKWIKEHN